MSVLARYSLTFLLLCAVTPQIDAGSLTGFRVSENSGVYYIRITMVVHAPANYVRRVLTDFVHIYRLNPDIRESGILKSPQQGVVRVKTLIHDCVAFFCKDVRLVEDVRELKSGDLQAVIVPKLSNLKFGSERWKIRGMGAYTGVTYQAEMKPDFFIPPIIGSYLVKEKIREESMLSFARLECIAQIQESLKSQRQPLSASLSHDLVCGDHCRKNATGCQP